jgi:asparagine synthase (glutamine-hydrolysing)
MKLGLRTMCGIAGIVLSNDYDPSKICNLIARMGNAQRRRGPDGAGVWVNRRVGLGCVRLAITGDEIRGAQPLTDRWGGTLVFNGEIYEPAEVMCSIGETYSARSSDGLALAAILALKGPEGLVGVRGAFACARYDSVRQRILLVRDAIGKKPLYVKRFRDGWIFASTIRAIHAVAGPLQRRREAVQEYLMFRSVGGCHSAFEGVEQIAPGGWLEISLDGALRGGRWWKPPEVCVHDADTTEVRRQIDAAIAARLAPDREVAVFLSGGLDSGIVAASLRHQKPDQRVTMYSIGYDVNCGEDETGEARLLARYLEAEHEVINLRATEVPQLFEDVAYLTEDPIQDPVTLPTLALARSAVKRTKIVLTGDGSDEIWGGYARFDQVPENLHDYIPRLAIFQPNELGLRDYPESWLDSIPEAPQTMKPLDRACRLEVSNRLRNYHLSRVDKLTMGCGLEARCPFLDIRVVNTGLSIAAYLKRPAERPKGLLIDSFVDLLPDWLVTRRKQPFSVPIQAWLRGPLRTFAADVLLSHNAYTRQFVDVLPYFEALDTTNTNAQAAASKLWSLVQLEIWDRTAAMELETSPCR